VAVFLATKERLNVIRQMISAEKKVSVSDLSSQFRVTEETIRRDLEKLETQGLVTRTYGGAVLNTESAYEGVSFYKRAAVQAEAKQKIAVTAAAFLKGKSTIAADSSSTVMETLLLLKDCSDVTLLTNSAEALRSLVTGKISIVSTGGLLNRNSLSLQGAVAKNTVRNYNVDIMLMSCKGLSLEKGALDSNDAEAEVKKVMAAQAEKVALLIDHTKFGRVGFVQLADFDHIHYIVTDCRPPEEWMQLFGKKEIQVLY
jgi:DeoR/GlpR family transcriptional regulator of sugar metabolism